MNAIESKIIAYIKRRHEDGALSASAAEIMHAITPPDQPQLRFSPSYKYALDRLQRRYEINAVAAKDGTWHYFIGNFPSRELRESLGL